MIEIESVMTRDARVVGISEMYKLLISDKFYSYIKDAGLMENKIQSSIDISEAINMLYTASSVARPVIYSVPTTDLSIDPSKSLYIEFNNKLYNLSDREYDIEIGRDSSTINVSKYFDEELIPDIERYPSDRVYEIRDSIRNMLRMR